MEVTEVSKGLNGTAGIWRDPQSNWCSRSATLSSKPRSNSVMEDKEKQQIFHTWACTLKWKPLFHYYREGNGNPLQYSCLEDPMDGGAWWTTVHDVAQSRTRLSSLTFTFPFHALEKDMQPTPVFFPGESQWQGYLGGCCLWGCTESDTTAAT